jgi:hypothetical protein
MMYPIYRILRVSTHFVCACLASSLFVFFFAAAVFVPLKVIFNVFLCIVVIDIPSGFVPRSPPYNFA